MKRHLIVNLSNRKIDINYISNDEKSRDKDDLNFYASSLSGYEIIGVNRIEVSANNIKSKAGGFFSHYLKCNNYDSISIKGKSSSPVFIYINKNLVEIYDAKDIYFMNYKESKEVIEKVLGEKNIEICSISTAGACNLDFSKIMFGSNKSCGKDGLGKIMGEKNLKAIILKKLSPLKLKNETILEDINNKINDRLNRDDINSYFLSENSCYGCNVNCKSTSVKQLIKNGIDNKKAEQIDNLCNEYGMDSIKFSQFLDDKEDIYNLADKMMKNPDEYKIEADIKKKTKKEENIFDRLGFCRFLTNKDIVTKEELDELIQIIGG